MLDESEQHFFASGIVMAQVCTSVRRYSTPQIAFESAPGLPLRPVLLMFLLRYFAWVLDLWLAYLGCGDVELELGSSRKCLSRPRPTQASLSQERVEEACPPAA